ncbi:MAG: hypothetical protein K2X39_04665 [Silvanigrellaceae bacterium]|nr:hypothetical protein [Silvanigrellaceae bacterium]
MLRHFFFLFRTSNLYDLNSEKDESSWQFIRSAVHHVKQEYIHGLLLTKEESYKTMLRNNRKITKLYWQSSFIQEDLPDSLFIPDCFIYKSKDQFDDFFLYFIMHIADANPDRFSRVEGGISIDCPLIPNDVDENDEFITDFTVDMTEPEFWVKVKERFNKNRQQHQNALLYSLINEDKFEFWRNQGVDWWFFDENLVKYVGITKIKDFLGWCRKNKLNVRKRLNENELREEVVRVVQENKEELRRFFPVFS